MPWQHWSVKMLRFVCPTISRLKTVWQQEFQQWQKRNLSEKRYVYFWADGITATFAWMINNAFWSLWVPLLMV